MDSEKNVFSIFQTENKYNLTPTSIEYIITDEEFLSFSENIIKDTLGIPDFKLRIHSGTDNEVKLIGDKKLIDEFFDKIDYGNERNKRIYSSYYILKHVLDNSFGENVVYSCTTSYRSESKYYVNILASYSPRGLNSKINLLPDKSKEAYMKLNNQLDILNRKKIEILHDKKVDS